MNNIKHTLTHHTLTHHILTHHILTHHTHHTLTYSRTTHLHTTQSHTHAPHTHTHTHAPHTHTPHTHTPHSHTHTLTHHTHHTLTPSDTTHHTLTHSHTHTRTHHTQILITLQSSFLVIPVNLVIVGLFRSVDSRYKRVEFVCSRGVARTTVGEGATSDEQVAGRVHYTSDEQVGGRRGGGIGGGNLDNVSSGRNSPSPLSTKDDDVEINLRRRRSFIVTEVTYIVYYI